MAEQAISARPTALGASATELIQRLIRADTVNPPGNERAVQEPLAAALSAAGFECELLAAEPERPNLVARLRGRSEGPTLTLLGHTDTVRADPGEWTRDPWGGELVDGYVWGRGALDMKGQVAAEVAAGIELARSGWRPASGELLLVIVADEETGGGVGARWLCERHARLRSEQLLLCDYLVEPMLGVTLTPVIAGAGHKANVIPSAAEVLIDCRVPPGLDADHARGRLEELIGDGEYEIEFSEAVVGNRSALESPLADAISGWLTEADPGARLVPTVMPGFSDSHWFRGAFPDAVVYGFCPHRDLALPELAPLVHGADERIPIRDLELAAGFFHELPRRMLG